jgi:ATP-dependent DNA helicase DinG
MSLNFLRNFPYTSPRQIQTETLQLLQEKWNDYDVFVIQAPTAYGKSAVAKSIMNTCRSVSVITPTNLLVNQFLQEFPTTPTLHRMDSYRCEEWDRPCSVTRGKLMKFCKGCKCSSDLATAKYRRGPGIYNYYTYLSHKLYRDVLVVDEAHNLISTIKDRLALTLWRHDYRYPSSMWKPEQVQEWIRTLSPAKQKSKKIQALKEAVTYKVPDYTWQRTTEWFNGKGTLRGEPEERECIRLLPVDISKAPPMFWPFSEVRKVVLLSATIGPKDIEQLGLHTRRVCYLSCKSPIPAENRPIVPLSLMSVNRSAILGGEVATLARYIDAITQDHPEEKGVIHVTYQLSNLLRDHLTDSRYLFHTRDDKADRYAEFRDAAPSSGRVLVACGMYEGIDLPEDLGRWQIIAKVPWQSLASPAVKHLAELDPEWYGWECLKTTIQACGRVCRTPTDYGTTFIIDSSWYRLLNETKKYLPEWFTNAIVSKEDIEKYKQKLGIT